MNNGQFDSKNNSNHMVLREITQMQNNLPTAYLTGCKTVPLARLLD